MAVRTDLNLVVHRQIALEQAGRHPALRAGLQGRQGPPARPREPGAARQAGPAGDQGAGPGRLAGRGRGEADPPGRRVQAGRDHRDRLVRARRPGRLRRPERPPARPPGRRPPGRDDGRAWATARWGCSPRTGSRSTGCSPTSAPTRGRPDPVRQGAGRPARRPARVAARDQASTSASARSARHLPRFEGVHPQEAPPGFRGELRPYQCEGLGWLDYLQKFDFGGILADDMGLGKTDPGARPAPEPPGPAAVEGAEPDRRPPVAGLQLDARRPRSSRPRLRVLDYTGPEPPRHPRRVPRPRPDRHHLRDPADRHRRAEPDRRSTT